MTASTFPLGDDLARIVAALQQSLVVIQSRNGAGAGLVWAPGLIATSNHVVPHDDPRISHVDGDDTTGRVVARDTTFDVALVEAKTGAAPPVAVAKREPAPGELVLAVGHPWGQRGFVTAGVLLGAEPGKDAHPGYLKADLRLAPGNSGGPLSNARGEVIGINGMIAGGLGVATATYRVQQLAAALGEATTPGQLGIEVMPVAPAAGLVEAGLIVTQIDPEGAGWLAGLLPGDVIVEVEGYAGHVEMANRLARLQAGKLLPITVRRAGQRIDLAPTPLARAA